MVSFCIKSMVFLIYHSPDQAEDSEPNFELNLKKPIISFFLWGNYNNFLHLFFLLIISSFLLVQFHCSSALHFFSICCFSFSFNVFTSKHACKPCFCCFQLKSAWWNLKVDLHWYIHEHSFSQQLIPCICILDLHSFPFFTAMLCMWNF